MTRLTAVAILCVGEWLLLMSAAAVHAEPSSPSVIGRPIAGERPTVRGAAHSFSKIADVVAREGLGRVLRIRVIRVGERTAYVVRVLRTDNKRRDVLLDSVTLAVLEK